MKKSFYILLCMVISLSLAGCGSSGDNSSGISSSQQNSVSDVLESGMEAYDSQSSSYNGQTDGTAESSAGQRRSGISANAPAPEAPDPDAALSSTEGIDIDLTALSSTMVYAEVYDMVSDPDKYIGRTVRMRGDFASYHDETGGRYYFGCIIRDATACCAQGIEFVLTDDYVYPDDYPEEGSEVTVTGAFDTYREGESLYCTLRDAVLE